MGGPRTSTNVVTSLNYAGSGSLPDTTKPVGPPPSFSTGPIPGPPGPPGPDGPEGPRGPKGDPGDPGADGTNGTNGSPGAKGDKGDPGDPGADGTNGTNGAKGDKGDPGDPASLGGAGLFSARPSPGTAGRVYYPTDGPIPFVDDGTAWRPLLLRGMLGTTPPSAAGFTKIGATTATLADDKGTLLYSSDTGNEVYQYNTPIGLLSGTFQIDVVFETLWNHNGVSGQEPLFALALMNASSGAFERFGIYYSNAVGLGLQHQDFSDINTTAGSPQASLDITALAGANGPHCLRVVQDSTNLTFFYSKNGRDYHQFFQWGKTSYIVVDRVGLFTNTTGGAPTTHRVYSLRIQ